MKKEYEAPVLEDLGSLREETQSFVFLGIRLDGDGGSRGGGNTFS